MEQKQLLLPAPSEETLAKATMEINEFLEVDIPRVRGPYEEAKDATRTLCPPNLRKRFKGGELLKEMTQEELDSYPEGYFRTVNSGPRKRFTDEPVDLSGVVWSAEAIAMHVPMAPPVKRKRFTDEPVDLSAVVWSKEAIAMFVPMAPVKRKRF